jgi:hypothetical protein
MNIRETSRHKIRATHEQIRALKLEADSLVGAVDRLSESLRLLSVHADEDSKLMGIGSYEAGLLNERTKRLRKAARGPLFKAIDGAIAIRNALVTVALIASDVEETMDELERSVRQEPRP